MFTDKVFCIQICQQPIRGKRLVVKEERVNYRDDCEEKLEVGDNYVKISPEVLLRRTEQRLCADSGTGQMRDERMEFRDKKRSREIC